MPVLRYWDTTAGAWVDLGGTGSPEVYIGNDPPATRVSEVLWVDTDDTGVPGQRWSPEYTLSTAQMAAGTQNPLLSMTHNLGSPGLVLGHLEDGSWAHQCGWRASIDSTQMTIAVFNHGPSPAIAVIRFRILY